MIKCIHCNIQEHSFAQTTDVDQIAGLMHEPAHIFWLDLEAPTEHELALITQTFHLHPLAVEDATHKHQRPKIEEYEHFFFLVFYMACLDAGKRELDIRELNSFVGQNYLVTVHADAIEEMTEVEQRWKRNSMQVERGIGILLYSLLDTIVDRYFPVVDVLVDQAEELEDHLFEGKGRVREDELTFDLLALKKQFLAFRRIATPERDVLSTLTNRDSPFFSEHVLLYFRDIYSHLIHITETMDTYRDQITSIMDANLSVASNELNKVMRTLTVMSIILMFDALVAGVYGMNFEYIPELKWHLGYFWALALMAVVSSLLLLYFRRLRWF